MAEAVKPRTQDHSLVYQGIARCRVAAAVQDRAGVGPGESSFGGDPIGHGFRWPAGRRHRPRDRRGTGNRGRRARPAGQFPFDPHDRPCRLGQVAGLKGGQQAAGEAFKRGPVVALAELELLALVLLPAVRVDGPEGVQRRCLVSGQQFPVVRNDRVLCDAGNENLPVDAPLTANRLAN